MVRFCGFDLELLVDGVFVNRGMSVRSAVDLIGGQWLIVQVDDDPSHLVWVCAPISARALQAVVSGRATPRDAVRHSATGTVEVITVDRGRAVPDRSFCCASLPEHLLPPCEAELLVAA